MKCFKIYFLTKHPWATNLIIIRVTNRVPNLNSKSQAREQGYEEIRATVELGQIKAASVMAWKIISTKWIWGIKEVHIMPWCWIRPVWVPESCSNSTKTEMTYSMYLVITITSILKMFHNPQGIIQISMVFPIKSVNLKFKYQYPKWIRRINLNLQNQCKWSEIYYFQVLHSNKHREKREGTKQLEKGIWIV